MKKLFILAALLGFIHAEPGWNTNTVYTYNINSKSLSSLNEMGHDSKGVIIKGSLQLHTVSASPGSLSGQLRDLQYAEVHSTSSNGCSLPDEENSLDWKKINFSNNTFGVILNKGVIKKLLFKKNISTEEANIIRAVISQLQIDLDGKNKIVSTIFTKNYNTDNASTSFSTMEESVTGECETIYDISPLPEIVIRSRSSLAPLLSNSSELQSIMDVTKISNFNNCMQHIVYHKGMNGKMTWDGDHSKLGNVFSRSAKARLIVNGTYQNYTLHSSVRIDKILIIPSFYKTTKAMAWSCMNLTLVDVEKSEISVSVVNETETTLLYDHEYESAENHASFGYHLDKHRKIQEDALSSPHKENITNLWHTTPVHNVSSTTIPTTSINNKSVVSSIPTSTPTSLIQNRNFETSTLLGIISSTNTDNSTFEATFPHETTTSKLKNESFSSSSSNTINNMNDIKFANISSLLQILNVSTNLQNPYLSSLFSIYPSMRNKSSLQPQELQLAIKTISEKIAANILEFKSTINENMLSLFCDLTFIISNANYEVLHNVSKNIFQSSFGKGNRQNLSWAVFRDAVSQAGTGPSLILIKEWILTNKITENEAEDIIGQLSRTAEIQNEQYIEALFDMVKDPRFETRQLIHASVLFTFTNIIRQIFVDDHNEKMFSPIFNPHSDKNKLKSVYLQFLRKQLENAVLKHNNRKIHIYTRALGNVAHPEILNIFQQYMKNNSMTTFQKVLVVISLEKIAELYPAETRHFLYAIYINLKEHYEVRAASIFLIMQTKPPITILQKIAELTQSESSNQVIAAVKSSMQSAAQLTDPEDKEFKENVKSVIDLLNSRSYGMHYSYNFHGFAKLENLGFRQIFSSVGSDNDIIPKGLFFKFERLFGGLKGGKQNYGLMFADIKKVNCILQNLWNMLKRNFRPELLNEEEREKNNIMCQTVCPGEASIDFSSQNSKNESNKLTMESQNQQESVLLYHLANNEKFVTFGNNFSSIIENWFKNELKLYQTGYKFNYTKLFQTDSFFYAVPNTAGLITQITYRVPTIIHLTGKLKFNTFQGHKSSVPSEGEYTDLNLEIRFKFGYAFNKHTNIGLVTPFNRKQYNIGHHEQLLINIPIKMNTTVTTDNKIAKVTTKFQPLAQDTLGFYTHFNSQLYQFNSNLFDIVRKPGEKQTELIKTPTPKQIVKKIGGFHFNASLPKAGNEHLNAQNLFGRLDNIVQILEKLKFLNNMNIIFRGDFPREEDSVTFQMQYEKNYNYSTEGDGSTSNFSIHKHKSNKHFVKERNNTVYVEWKILFNEEKIPKYAANLSYTWNEISDKTKFSFSLLEKSSQEKCKHCHLNPIISFSYNGTWAKVPIFNFTEAILNDPKSEFTAILHLGKSKLPTVMIQCELQRTSQRRMYLIQQREANECEKDMQDDNLILPSCQFSTWDANFLDQHNCTLQIIDLKEKSKIYNLVSSTLNINHGNIFIYPHEHSSPANQISFLTQFTPNFKNANVFIIFPNTEVNFKNISIPSFMRPIAKIHPSYSVISTAIQELFERQYNPLCVLDKTKINTFDNRTYAVNLGNCWHVLMSLSLQKATNPKLRENDILILARDFNDGRTVKILIGNDVIDITPYESSPQSSNNYIYVNNKQYYLSNDKITSITLNGLSNNTLLLINMIGENIKLHFSGIFIIFDGIRIMMMTKNTHRNQILGLCGNFNGEESDDFSLPTQCSINEPQQFVASYAILNNNSCSEETIKSSFETFNKSCSLTRDIFIDTETPSVTSCHNDTNKESDPRCMIRYVKVDQNDKYTCFSQHALPKCKTSCHPIRIVKKSVNFHCVPSSLVSKHFVEKVKSGKIHDFGSKDTTQTLAVDVPTGCYKC